MQVYGYKHSLTFDIAYKFTYKCSLYAEVAYVYAEVYVYDVVHLKNMTLYIPLIKLPLIHTA